MNRIKPSCVKFDMNLMVKEETIQIVKLIGFQNPTAYILGLLLLIPHWHNCFVLNQKFTQEFF